MSFHIAGQDVKPGTDPLNLRVRAGPLLTPQALGGLTLSFGRLLAPLMSCSADCAWVTPWHHLTWEQSDAMHFPVRPKKDGSIGVALEI
jgi:hypothetical protein